MKTIKAKLFGISSLSGAILLASSLAVGAASDNERWNMDKQNCKSN